MSIVKQQVGKRPIMYRYNDIILAEIQRPKEDVYEWVASCDYKEVLPEWTDRIADDINDVHGYCKTIEKAIVQADAAAAKLLAKFQRLLGRAANRELKALEREKLHVIQLVSRFAGPEDEPAKPREFDAVVNGQSLYALDKAALEQLIVSVDWHLSHRDEVKR